MEKVSLRSQRPVVIAILLALFGLAFANAPAFAQRASAKWKPGIDTITITASQIPYKKLRELQSITTFGRSFLVVSASVPVPYSDLDLHQSAGSVELVRRIRVAARLACSQLDIKYPPVIYPSADGSDDCEQVAAKGGIAAADVVLANFKK